MVVRQEERDVRLVVADRVEAGEDVVLLDLSDADGADLPPWQPGAHIDLRLDAELVRQYSLCGEPSDSRTWRIAVLREPNGRGGSTRVHALEKGAEVTGRGPRNHFELSPSPRYLFIAGGIGITPILPMVREAIDAGAEWRLVYGGRTRDSMTFRAELQSLGGPRVTICPQNETGLLDLDGLLAEPLPDTLVYTCGPEPLLDAVAERCRHWPAGSLRMERFAPRAAGEPVRAGSFEVELASSGRTLVVPPHRSILDVVTEAGVDVLSSCTEGTCGTCETVVLAGRPDHRDSLLSAEEQENGDTMMICVSRAVSSRLVLDL